MADTSGFTIKSPSKKAPNVSSGWIVMVLSGLIAVVVFFAVTSQGGAQTQVLIAAHDIAVGDKVDSSSFHLESVNLTSAQLSHLITAKSESSVNGYIATNSIASGDLVNKSALKPASGNNGLRTLSLPIDKSRAADGNISIGDRVDIINEGKDNSAPATYAATDIQVTGVTTSGGGALTSSASSNFVLTLAVTSDQALAIADTLKQGKIDVIRSTGATPIGGSTNTDSSAIPSTSTTSTTVAP